MEIISLELLLYYISIFQLIANDSAEIKNKSALWPTFFLGNMHILLEFFIFSSLVWFEIDESNEMWEKYWSDEWWIKNYSFFFIDLKIENRIRINKKLSYYKEQKFMLFMIFYWSIKSLQINNFEVIAI